MASDAGQEASKAVEGGKQLAGKTAGFIAKRFNPLSLTGLPLTVGACALGVGAVWIAAPGAMVASGAIAPTMISGAGLGSNALSLTAAAGNNVFVATSVAAKGAGSMIVNANYAAAGEALGQFGSAMLAEGGQEMALHTAETVTSTTMTPPPVIDGGSITGGLNPDVIGKIGEVAAEGPQLKLAG